MESKRNIGNCWQDAYVKCAFTALYKLDFILNQKIGTELPLLVVLSHCQISAEPM
jgi:hypothetical protein